MAQRRYLLNRNGRFYFRKRVPTELQGTLCATALQWSLGTSNLGEAKALIPEAELKAQQIIREALTQAPALLHSGKSKPATGTPPTKRESPRRGERLSRDSNRRD